jgi:hypothetical protein
MSQPTAPPRTTQVKLCIVLHVFHNLLWKRRDGFCFLSLLRQGKKLKTFCYVKYLSGSHSTVSRATYAHGPLFGRISSRLTFNSIHITLFVAHFIRQVLFCVLTVSIRPPVFRYNMNTCQHKFHWRAEMWKLTLLYTASNLVYFYPIRKGFIRKHFAMWGGTSNLITAQRIHWFDNWRGALKQPCSPFRCLKHSYSFHKIVTALTIRFSKPPKQFSLKATRKISTRGQW